jgi:hypothetical protein
MGKVHFGEMEASGEGGMIAVTELRKGTEIKASGTGGMAVVAKVYGEKNDDMRGHAGRKSLKDLVRAEAGQWPAAAERASMTQRNSAMLFPVGSATNQTASR